MLISTTNLKEITSLVLHLRLPHVARTWVKKAHSPPPIRMSTAVCYTSGQRYFLAYSTLEGLIHFLPSFSKTVPVTAPSTFAPPHTSSWYSSLLPLSSK